MAEVGAATAADRSQRGPLCATTSVWHETGNRSNVRARLSNAFVVVSVVVTALSAGACRKSSEEQRREAQKATAEAEEQASQVSQTTITNAEIGASDGPRADERRAEAQEEAREAHDRALREHAEAITSARNEQLEYRGKLQSALDRLDVKRRETKKRGQVHLKALDAKRDVLKHDLDALDRTADSEWASLKAKIDRDLKDHAGAGEAEGK